MGLRVGIREGLRLRKRGRVRSGEKGEGLRWERG